MLWESTERPVTVARGTNTVVGHEPERIVSEALWALDSEGRCGARAGGCEAVNYS
jgi:UDP-N-acetylglucosamine 2-epimerase